MIKSCPGSTDVTDLQFKLQCRLQIFHNNDISLFFNPVSLVSCASRYGLLFVGRTDNNFQVLQTKNLQEYSPKDKEIKTYPRRIVNIPSLPKHVCINCDSTVLAVVIEKDQCPVVLFYDVLSFLKNDIKVLREVRLSSTPNVYVKEVNWNPSIPGIFTACKSDGSLGVYELKGESVDINELPSAAGATCFCWSPKGKQIAVGSRDGKITQYKPDLKAVKVIGEPKFGNPHSLISLQWVSNYQFIGVYQEVPEGGSRLVVVDAPKAGEPSYTNYDDVCYSGSSRPPQFYLNFQQNWNFLMVASANGTEVGVLGNNGESWRQWIMPDFARAELPLSLDYQETLPVGLSLDISSTTPLPWGESSIPPCPLLCVLSHQGVLSCFNVVYLKDGIPSVCTPPDSVADQSGLSKFVTSSNSGQSVISQATPVKPIFDTQPVRSSVASTPKPVFSFTAPVQSTPLNSGMTLSETSAPFPDQTTLTPIKGSTLFGGQTLITPVTKPTVTTSLAQVPVQATTATSVEKTLPANEKYSSIFSSLGASIAPQVPAAAAPVKPIVINAFTQPKTEVKEKPTPEIVPKQDTFNKLIPKQETEVVDPDLKFESSAMFNQMIKDEWLIMDTELKVLLKQCLKVKVDCGTEQEKVDMVLQIDNLEKFVKEAIDISIGQSSEIHALKQSLLQSWAWLEEARSHYHASKNETVALLIKLQPLDSVAEKKLKDIKQLIYYLESQLSQASKTLDEQWDNFQNFAKKKYRVQMPTMETIFQTMVNHSAVLQKQTYVLKDIAMRLRKKPSESTSLLLSLDKANELADNLKDLHLSTRDVTELQYEKIRHYTNCLTGTKINKLKELVKQRGVTVIKPQLPSAPVNSSASKLKESIAKLGVNITPVSRAAVARNLDFTQLASQKGIKDSTPSIPLDSKVSSLGDNTTQKSSFMFKSSSVTSTTGFISLAKTGSGIISTPGSAFAPTGSIQGVDIAKSQSSIIGSSASSTVSFNVPKTSTFASGDSSAFVAKPVVSNTAMKLQPKVPKETIASQGTPSFGFSFGQGSTPVTTKTVATSLFSSTPSSTFMLTKTEPSQMHIPDSKTSNSNASSHLVKPIQTPPTTTASEGAFGSQLFSFGTSKSSTIATTPITTVSASITQPISLKSTSATPFIGETRTPISFNQSEAPKPALSFGFPAASTPPSFSIPSISSAVSTTSTSSVTSNSEALFKPANTVPINLTSQSSESAKPTVTDVTNSGLNIFGSSGKPTAVSGSSLFAAVSKSAENTTTVTQSSIFNTKPIVISTTPQGTTSAPFSFSTSSSNVPKSTFGNVLGSTATSPLSTENSGTSTAASPLFGNFTLTSAAPSSVPGGLTTSTPSIFQSSSEKPSLFQPSSVSSSIFGSTVIAKTTPEQPVTTATVFGGVATSTQPESTATVTTASLFGKVEPVTTTSIFNTPKTSASVFGGSPSITVTATESSNIFGSSAPVFSPPAITSSTVFNTPPENIFSNAATSSASNIFGGTTQNSIFNSPTTSTPSIFGKSTTAPISSSSSIFGSPATTASFGSQNNSIFASAAKSPPSIFGQSPVFGSSPFNTTQPQATTTSVFGQSTTNVLGFGSTTTTSNSFPTSSASTGTFGFGGLNVGSTTPSGSIFGGTSTGFGQAPNENPFGKVEVKPAFGSSSTSIFAGAPSNTGSASIFGSPATTSSIGSTNVFGSPATTTSIGSTSIFGSPATTSSIGSTNIFGSPATTSAIGSTSIFGTPATTTSIFGSNTGSAFGSSDGNFGSQNTFASPSFGQKSVFGQTATFGSPGFGASQTAGAFSAGGGGSVAQSGFGSPSSFQKPTGFGSPPVFGGSPAAVPAFGAAPSFGGTPAFGAAPTFGSPDKVFGSSQQPTGFGSMATAQPNTGFGNMSSQNTIGFGNLAQQANTPTSMPFSGGSSFSTWR